MKMKKMVTYLAVLTMMLTAVQPAVMQAAAASDDMPAASVAVQDEIAAIVGTWVRADSIYANNCLSIDGAGSFTVEDHQGNTFSGTVEFAENEYRFLKEDGTLWNCFSLQEFSKDTEYALTDAVLFAQQNTDTAKIHFADEDVNEDDYELEDVTFVRCPMLSALNTIVGEWREPIGEGFDYNTLLIEQNGRFTYCTNDGTVTGGRIHVTADLHEDNTGSFWYSFCEADGTFWAGIAVPGFDDDCYQMAVGQDGSREFRRVLDGEFEFRGKICAAAGDTVKVMREPNETADVLTELDGTVFLDFFTCEEKGWYGVMLGDGTGDDDFGFVKTEHIQKIGTELADRPFFYVGQITAEDAAILFEAPDSDSAAAAQIMNGAVLDIYEAEEPGWFVAEYCGAFGYIRMEDVQQYVEDGTFLFTGTVTPASGSSVDLMAAPFEEAAVIESLPAGTIVDVSYCAADGWYSINAGESFGYLRVEDVFPDAEPVASACALAGEWISADNRNLFLEHEILSISDSGVCTASLPNGESVSGTVYIDEISADDDCCPIYYGTITFENDGVVNADFILDASGLCFIGDEPLKYVPYNVQDAMTRIAGNWLEDTEDGYNILTVSRDGEVCFTNADQTFWKGYVVFLCEQYEDSDIFWYMVYHDDGTPWESYGFAVPDEYCFDDLYTGQDGARHFYRDGKQILPDNEESLERIVGSWYYETVPYETYDYATDIAEGQISVLEDGSFSFLEFETQTVIEGTVKLEYEEFADGSTLAWYNFYKEDGSFWIGCCRSENPDENYVFFIGQDTTEFLIEQSYVMAMGHSHYNQMISRITGKWTEDADNGSVLFISEEGRFTVEDAAQQTVVAGNILVENEEHPDGSFTEWYSFYTDEGDLWNGIAIDGTEPAEELYTGQDGATRFVRAEEPVQFVYSDEELCEMALNAYEEKTGIRLVSAHTMHNYGGTVTIVLQDENGEDVDAYTVDPSTGIGEQFSDSSEVTLLPKTGNNSLTALLLAIGAFLMTGCGLTALLRSGMLRRRNEAESSAQSE